MFVSMLMAFSMTTPAQDNATPAPAPAAGDSPATPAQTEMQKWIATTDAQWQAVFTRDVTDVMATELKKLEAQYVASLEAAITKASSAGDLDGVVALRNEQKRFAETHMFPEQDEATDAASVKQLRAATHTQLAKLSKDNAARARALHAKYDQFLAQTQTQLTQRQRIDDALLVKAKRDEVAGAWLAGLPAVAPADAPAKPAPPVAKTNPTVPVVPAVAAEKNLFTNGNFENGAGDWELVAFEKNGTMTIDTKELRLGKPTLRIDNHAGDHSFVRQLVGKPNTHYRLSGYIKTLNVEPVKKGVKEGACLLVGFTAEVRGGKTTPIHKTQSWTKVSVDFTTTSKTEIRVGASLGSYNAYVTGTAWFSDLTLTELGRDAKK